MSDARIPVVILCGGAGTRLSEQTEIRPKPLVEIGGRPILWHIMKHYSKYGFNEFVLALGYKGDQIKRYFLGYHAVWQDITVNLGDGSVSSLNKNKEPWTVHLVDTGESTLHEGWINGGFFVVEPQALDYITTDVMWEHAPMEALAKDGQLFAFRHEEFWQCMDTVRDLRYLESLWDAGRAPWKTW